MLFDFDIYLIFNNTSKNCLPHILSKPHISVVSNDHNLTYFESECL